MTSSKRVDTLICHTTMCRHSINFLYNSCHVTLWCLEVVPVVYARVIITDMWKVNACKPHYLTGQWLVFVLYALSSHKDIDIPGRLYSLIRQCYYWKAFILHKLLQSLNNVIQKEVYLVLSGLLCVPDRKYNVTNYKYISFELSSL